MSVVWPQIDTFEDGTEPYGDSVRGYLRATPDGISTYVTGHLVDTYVANGVAGNTDDGLSGSTGVAAFLRREIIDSDQSAKATFRLFASGAATASQLLEVGVIARSQTADSQPETYGPTASLDGVDGYVFRIRNVSGTARFQLMRAGANPTTLADTPVSALFAIDFAQPHTLELVATDDGGDVRLRCYISAIVTLQGQGGLFLNYKNNGGPGGKRTVKLDGSGTSAQDGVPIVQSKPNVGTSPSLGGLGGKVTNVSAFEVFDFTDTGANVIQGDSRVGFTIGTEQPLVGNQVIHLCDEFTIAEVGSGDQQTVVWRDDWTRATKAGAVTIPSALPSFSGGNSLEGDYTRDGGSDLPSQDASGSGALLRDPGDNDRAYIDGTVDAGVGVSLSGSSAQYLSAGFGTDVPPIGDPASAAVTYCIWAKPSGAIRDGFEMWSNLQNVGGNWFGVSFGFRDDDGTNLRAQLRIGNGTTTVQEHTGTVDIHHVNEFVGEAYLYAFVYEGSGSTAGGIRARIYRGRQGVVELIDTIEPVVAKPFLPQRHVLGRREGYSGTDAETLFAGELDSPTYFQRALTVAEIGILANEVLSREQVAALDPAHASSFEDNDYSGSGSFDLENDIPAASVPWTAESGVTPTSAGLTVDAIDSLALYWHRRPAGDPLDQRRSVLATSGDDDNVLGIMLRGSIPGADETVWTGYLATVRNGTPARVDVYRVTSGAFLPIGRQSTSSGVDLTGRSAFTFDVQVTEQSSGGPAVITVRINGTQVPLQAISASGSTSVDSVSRLVDAPVPMISGSITGFAAAAGGTAMTVDTWSDLDPAEPPGSSSSARLVLPTEADIPCSGNLTDLLPVDSRIEYMPVNSQQRMAMETGHTRNLSLMTYTPRVLRITITNPLAADLTALRTFVDEHGVATGFRFDVSRFRSRAVDGMFVFYEPSGRIPEVRRVMNAARYELVLREIRKDLI